MATAKERAASVLLKAMLDIRAAMETGSAAKVIAKVGPIADRAIDIAKTAGVELEVPPPTGLSQDTTELETKILADAKRRAVYADNEARVHNVDIKLAQRAIKNLKRRGQIYVASETKPSGFGQPFKGFRATDRGIRDMEQRT